MECKISDLEAELTTRLSDMENKLLVENKWLYVGRVKNIRILPERIIGVISIEKYFAENLGDSTQDEHRIWKIDVDAGYALISNGKPLHVYREQLKKEAWGKGFHLTEKLFDILFSPIEQKLLYVYAQNRQKMQ